MNISPTVYQSTFFTLACTSWSLVEVPRYLFYAVNLMGAVPYPLFWLRYSLFAILYPTGITGELGCMYMAVAYLIGNHVKSVAEVLNLPRNNLILLVFIVLVILTYIPGKNYGVSSFIFAFLMHFAYFV
jgi:very-long-chain (3R)-3-hydroxyacyl-CoA dehydratase